MTRLDIPAHPTLREVEKMTAAHGEILRQGFSLRPGVENKVQVKYKGEIDLVTEIDHRSEAYLIDEIRRRHPDHSINAEESGKLSGEACCTWYIDPLDGTVNYAHGIPLFAVSLGYAEAGVPLLGAVYNPISEECYTAARGKGAWLNGLPLRVGSASSLIQSLLVTGFPYRHQNHPAQQPGALLPAFPGFPGCSRPRYGCDRSLLPGCRPGGWVLGNVDHGV